MAAQPLAVAPAAAIADRRAWADRAASAALAVAVFLAAVVAVAAASGLRTEVILTGSMRPTLSPDDMVLVHHIDASQMRVGDIVSFQSPENPDMVITHRVRAVRARPGGMLAVVTRGDANNTPERWTIARTGSVARVVATIPLAGRLTAWTGDPVARTALFALLGLGLAGFGLRKVWSA